MHLSVHYRKQTEFPDLKVFVSVPPIPAYGQMVLILS